MEGAWDERMDAGVGWEGERGGGGGGRGEDVSRDEGMRADRATGKDFGVGFGWSSGEKVDT